MHKDTITKRLGMATKPFPGVLEEVEKWKQFCSPFRMLGWTFAEKKLSVCVTDGCCDRRHSIGPITDIDSRDAAHSGESWMSFPNPFRTIISFLAHSLVPLDPFLIPPSLEEFHAPLFRFTTQTRHVAPVRGQALHSLLTFCR
eukprot:scaffold3487_cov251-Pinguiococcus_pyrenoidosus.AAC.3